MGGERTYTCHKATTRLLHNTNSLLILIVSIDSLSHLFLLEAPAIANPPSPRSHHTLEDMPPPILLLARGKRINREFKEKSEHT